MEKEQDFDNSGSTGKNGSQDSYDSFDLEFQNGMSEFVDQIMKEEALQKHIDQKKEHNSLEHNEETSFKKDDIDTLRERTNRIINQYKDTEMSMGDSTVNEEKEVAENNMKSEHELSDMEKKDDKNLDETNAKMFSPISDYNKHQKDEDMLNEISMELAKQINDEIDPNKDDNDRVNEDVVEEEKRKFPRWAKIVTSVVAVLVSLTLVFVGTPWGRKQLKKIAVSIATEYAYGKMDYDDGSNVVVQDPVEDCDVTGDTDDSLSIIWGNSGYDGYASHDDNVINTF